MIPKYFHYISHLKWLFFVIGVYFVSTESIIRDENYLSGIGLGITLIGIGFAIGSLSDIEKLTKKEKKIVSNPKRFKKETKSLFVGTCLGLLASVFFFLIPFINLSLYIDTTEGYTNLGYGTVAFALGMFLELKQLYEKRLIFKKQNEIS
ncbi:MAG: hypothetical protein QM486_10950 [Flavobacteriaceae bacterium]